MYPHHHPIWLRRFYYPVIGRLCETTSLVSWNVVLEDKIFDRR